MGSYLVPGFVPYSSTWVRSHVLGDDDVREERVEVYV